MKTSSSTVRLHRWKSVLCGVAVATAVASAAPAGAAAPTVPGAPTGVVATAGIRSVNVAFTAPASDGGAKVANYHVTCTSSDGGRLGQREGTKSPIFVAGLTPAKTYTCTVAARNRVGLGANSDPSAAVVVLASAPGAPAITAATAGVRSVKLTFTKPLSDGGAKITSYRAKCTSSDGGKPGARDGLKSPIVVGGLSAGKTYTCTVAARNRAGLGTASAPSTAVVTLSH